jgi:hypothetical protein
MKAFLRAWVPSGWEMAAYAFVGLAFACHERSVRRDVARETWASTQIETVKEPTGDGVSEQT